MKFKHCLLACTHILGLWGGLGLIGLAESQRVRTFTPKVLRKIPHPEPNFTQGLVLHESYLYESTGLRGQSVIKQIDPETGSVLRQKKLSKQFFGEGLACHKDQLLQLTWQAGKAFVYTASNLALERTFTYHGEGWGLSTYRMLLKNKSFKNYWIMSDGSHRLQRRDMETFEVTQRYSITDEAGRPIRLLNELEVVSNRFLYANVWRETFIVVIDMRSWTLIGRVLCKHLMPRQKHWAERRKYVLNGIAYDPKTKNFYLTGKKWPFIYEVRLLPSPS